MRRIRLMMLATGLAVATAPLAAQTPANDPSDRLRKVLPADVADHVLAVIAAARAHDLPAEALENRALKFAARGVPPRDVSKAIDEQAERMSAARDTLQHARPAKPTKDEVEAGAEAMRQGVHGEQVSTLAKSAPSGRSLAVPLLVIGSLVDRGLPSDSALMRVLARLKARASDRELSELPNAFGQSQRDAHAASTGRPADPGNQGQGQGSGRPATTPATGTGATGRPAGSPPAGVPANGGNAARPTTGKPTTTPPTKRP